VRGNEWRCRVMGTYVPVDWDAVAERCRSTTRCPECDAVIAESGNTYPHADECQEDEDV